jgi:outer membrane protein assembly factor BamA
VAEYQNRDWFTVQIVPAFGEGELVLEVQELPVLGHRFAGQGDVPAEEVQGMISVPVGEVGRISQVQESLGRLGRSVYFSQAEVVPELGEGGVWLRWELKERVLLEEPAGVRKIELVGVEALPAEGVLGRLGPLPEGEVTNYQVLRALSPVYDYYRREGFFLFDLAKAGLEEGVLRVEVREGRVGEVRVEGNARTQERVVRRVAGIREGEFLTEARYAAARQALMSLGYFSDVVLEPIWGEESVVLTVRVTEQARLGSIRGSLGYSPGEGGLVGELTYSQKNLWGTAQDLSLSFSRTVTGAATTTWGLGYQGHALPAFDLVGLNLYRRSEGETLTLGGRALFFYPLAPYWDLTLSLTSEQAWEEGELVEPRNVLAPGLAFDSIDNPYFPRRGQRLSLTLDKAGTFAPGVEYLSISADGAWFWPLDVATPIWEGRAAFAQRLLLSSGWDLPERYLFELGGVDSVRGAQTIKTDRLALLNTELRFELASGFSLALFWDLGWGRGEPGALLKTSGGIELAAHIAGMFVRLDMAWPNDRPLSWVPMFEFGMAPLF